MTFLIQNFASQDHVGFVKKKKIRATVLYTFAKLLGRWCQRSNYIK